MEISNFSTNEDVNAKDDNISTRYLTRAELRKRDEVGKTIYETAEKKEKENVNNQNVIPAHIPKIPNNPNNKEEEAIQVRKRKKPQRPSSTTTSQRVESNQLKLIVSKPKAPPIELIHELDKKNKSNPQKVPYYAYEIFRYLKSIEKQMAAPPDYMTKVQRDINERMRKMLVDWMIDAHLKLRLLPQVLYLSVSIVDRYLSRVAILRTNLQLVGVTALLIASKNEEIYPSSCDNLLYMTDYSYTMEQVLLMEAKILIELEFKLNQPLVLYFMNRYLENLDIKNQQLILMVNFLLELSIVEYSFLKYMPSLLAAAALYLSHKTFHIDIASDFFLTNTEYSFNQLEDCCKDLCVSLYTASEKSTSAVYRKYSRNCFGKIAHNERMDADKPKAGKEEMGYCVSNHFNFSKL